MELYRKDNISVSLIQESDIGAVIGLFNSNTFNVDLGNSVRPSDMEFESIIRDNINREKKLETVLVLKRDDNVIGYLSCFISYSRLVLGHIAVRDDEQHKGYGRLLTIVALYLASKQNRDVTCVCYHSNKYLGELGFVTRDNINYIYKGRLESEEVPDVFMSIEEYSDMKKRENEEEIESFRRFMKSDLGLLLRNL